MAASGGAEKHVRQGCKRYVVKQKKQEKKQSYSFVMSEAKERVNMDVR